VRALLEILVLGWRGGMVRRVKRLRDPRQILALIAGIAYFAFFALRPLLMGFGRSGRGLQRGLPGGLGTGEYAPALQLAIAFGLAVVVANTWIFTSSRPAFSLSEAEIHLLLPAPLTRRRILQFALLKRQAGILFGSLVFALLTALRWSGSPAVLLPRLVGYWGFLTLLDLHLKGVSLWKARLLELPPPAARRRRALAILVGAAWCAAVLLGLWLAWQRDGAGRSWSVDDLPASVLSFVHAVRTGIAGWSLAPFLWLAAAVAGAGLVRLGGVLFLLALLAAHYQWIVRSSARFEEAALERARRQAERGARRHGGASHRQTGRERSPFRLEAAPAAELAITWKNLLLRGRMPLVRLARLTLLGLAALALAAFAMSLAGAPSELYVAFAFFGLVLLAILSLMAGLFLRHDLRADFLHLEILRAWPVAGWRLVAAEVLAPVVTLLWLQLVTAGAVAVMATAGAAAGEMQRLLEGGAPRVVALAASLVAAVVLGAAIGTLSLSLQNLGVLLFPGWVPLGFRRSRGTALIGQNMLVGVGHLLAMLLAAIPPLLVAALVFALLNLLLGLRFTVWEVPLLAIAAAVPFLVEAFLVIRFAGAIWDRLDPSRELLDPAT
jgi:hypothetical protein